MHIKTFIAGLLNALLFIAALAGSGYLLMLALPYLGCSVSPENNQLDIVVKEFFGTLWGIVIFSAAIVATVISVLFLAFSIAQMRRIKIDAARFKARSSGTIVYIVFTFIFALILAASNLVVIDNIEPPPYIIPTAAAGILALSNFLLLMDLAGNKKRLKKQKEQALMNNFSQQMREKEL